MIWHIARRELLVRLRSPFAWVVAGTWLAVQGLMFTLILGLYLQAGSGAADLEQEGLPLLSGLIEPLYSAQSLLLLLFMPLLSMSLLAAEQRGGTLSLLLSSPVSTLEVVLGKWLGLLGYVSCLLFVGGALAPITLVVFGDPPLAPMAGAALGLLLLAAALSALGLLASALSGSQLVAAVVTWTTSLGLWLLAVLEAGDGPFAALGRHGSLLVHTRSFGRGLVDGTDVTWLIAFAFVALLAAWQRLESWRWR
ncbi:MAG: ABC transporter permease [Deltaproteobacteria bacterium]|nr:ABC transporter permease [Deltaproteobacteria bacterium]